MAKVFPVIMKDPDVQKRPTVEGERVGKLLRKYTTLLEQYKPEAEARLIKLIEALMSNKGVKLFWKCVLENYRPVDETSKKTTEKSSKTTVEETVMETIETSSDDI